MSALRLWALAAFIAACANAAITLKDSNPYQSHSVYVNPTWAAKVTAAITAHPTLSCKYQKVATYPSYIWLDKIAMIDKLTAYMDDAKAKNQMIQLVIYDLPNRDCAAAASNGELSVDSDGLNKYKTQYIDKIKAILDNYPTVPVAMLIEPDSLPNLVTNMNVAKCTAAKDAYLQGTAYAISKLAAANHWMYIDMGHECWLGWTNNQNGWITVLNSMLALATDTSSLRGFATNTANYQNVHMATGYVGCGGGNSIYDDATYVKVMSELMRSQGVFTTNPQFIIDTARNGANDPRKDTSQWCNIKNTGIGKRPALGTTDSQVSYVDAFTWSKPPGESDGTSDSSATRYDYHCGSTESLGNAPEAGEWFDAHFQALVEKAVPAITCDGDTSDVTPTADSSTTTGGGGSGTTALPGQTSNPYAKYSSIFLDPVWQSQVETSISSHKADECLYRNVMSNPTFIWLDNIAMIDKLDGYMQSAKDKGQMIQLVIYDLPNRDCAAAASNGELSVDNDGLNKYKTQYITPIKNILDKYPTVPTVLLIEPDSLPNLVTNLNVAKCSAANEAYRAGVAYALTTLAASNRWMYIDMGHECWLGWTNNQNGWITVIKDVLGRVSDTTSIRGFATNTANYQNVHMATGYATCGGGNPIYDDATYVKVMSELMKTQGVFSSNPQFIIDTARNGANDPRKDTSQWCNIKNTGIGARPALGTTDSQVSYVDAFTWSKPPGQSDGTSDSSATRYDYHCGSTESLGNAPEAGQWFDAHFAALVKNAKPAFSTTCPTVTSSTGGTVPIASDPTDPTTDPTTDASTGGIISISLIAVAMWFFRLL